MVGCCSSTKVHHSIDWVQVREQTRRRRRQEQRDRHRTDTCFTPVELDLLARHYHSAAIGFSAHTKAASQALHCDTLWGVPATVLSVLASSLALGTEIESKKWRTVCKILLMITTAVSQLVVHLYTHMKLKEKYEKHRSIIAQNISLMLLLEEFMARHHAKDKHFDWSAALEQAKIQKTQITRQSDIVAQSYCSCTRDVQNFNSSYVDYKVGQFRESEALEDILESWCLTAVRQHERHKYAVVSVDSSYGWWQKIWWLLTGLAIVAAGNVFTAALNLAVVILALNVSCSCLASYINFRGYAQRAEQHRDATYRWETIALSLDHLLSTTPEEQVENHHNVEPPHDIKDSNSEQVDQQRAEAEKRHRKRLLREISGIRAQLLEAWITCPILDFKMSQEAEKHGRVPSTFGDYIRRGNPQVAIANTAAPHTEPATFTDLEQDADPTDGYA